MTVTIEGLLNIDKPPGLTSHDVVNRIRRLGHIRRVGHSGTLDPLATGVLILCVGRATRLAEYLLGQPKTYEATIRLGQTTNTYDADGNIVAERPIHVHKAVLENKLNRFRGSFLQRAPLFSALKKDGQPLYKLARQGVVVEAPLRQVTIHELTLLSWHSPDLQVRVACSAGTYIRSLAHDLGEALGCGGHIAALRRTAVGTFTADTAISLAQLTADNMPSYLQPLDTAVSHLPRLDLPPADARHLQQGQRVPHHSDQTQDSLARVYDSDGHFIGIAVAAAEFWQPRKIFHDVRGE